MWLTLLNGTAHMEDITGYWLSRLVDIQDAIHMIIGGFIDAGSALSCLMKNRTPNSLLLHDSLCFLIKVVYLYIKIQKAYPSFSSVRFW